MRRPLPRGPPHVPNRCCNPTQQALHIARISRLRYVASYSTTSAKLARGSGDPRLGDLASPIEDQFAVIKEHYRAPRYPVVLAHGLLGFDELHVAGPFLPGVQYWRGISETLQHAGVNVFTTSVPPTASIKDRAKALQKQIAAKAGTNTNPDTDSEGRPYASGTVSDAGSTAHDMRANGVNIIAHSMGGLDARYMISRLSCPVPVRSLTTIATPHKGSTVADYVFKHVVGMRNVPRIYGAMETLGLQTGAFSQLTRAYMKEEFNPATPDKEGVRYFSYGAAIRNRPHWWSMFRQSHRILLESEGPNDGLVSVESSRWGGESGYRGTLVDVSHLDLINWTNRLRWLVWEWMGEKRSFNALAFYLSICDMLAEEGF